MSNVKSIFIKLGIVATVAGIFLSACNEGGGNGATKTPSVSYSQFLNYPGSVSPSTTVVTGIRGVDNSSDVYVSGIYTDAAGKQHGMIYDGAITPMNQAVTAWHALDYPSKPGANVLNTAFYGPNNYQNGGISVVGNYTTSENGSSKALGLLYQGPLDGSGTWTTLLPESLEKPGTQIINTIVHSNMGDIAVGNYDTDLITGKAFIYDIKNGAYYAITKPKAKSITAYGVWHNGGTSYTIAGGYSDADLKGISTGYLVDWDSSTHEFSNWTRFNYKNQPVESVISHFEGITTDGHGGYNLSADAADAKTLTTIHATFVHVSRSVVGSFGVATWTDLVYPDSSLMSANTVYQNNVLGVYSTSGSSAINSYIATVNK